MFPRRRTRIERGENPGADETHVQGGAADCFFWSHYFILYSQAGPYLAEQHAQELTPGLLIRHICLKQALLDNIIVLSIL
jgi:hypothetical protein